MKCTVIAEHKVSTIFISVHTAVCLKRNTTQRFFKHYQIWNFRDKNSSRMTFKLEHIYETDSKWSLRMLIENGDMKDNTLKPVRVSQYHAYFVQQSYEKN
jgi:hypothetical protein